MDGGRENSRVSVKFKGKSAIDVRLRYKNRKIRIWRNKIKIRVAFRLKLSFGDILYAITNPQQRFGEELITLDRDIKRLARLAYPERAEEIHAKIACVQFVNAINDEFTKRTLQLEEVTSLKIATDRTMVIKDI